jgi:hypothetical protein
MPAPVGPEEGTKQPPFKPPIAVMVVKALTCPHPAAEKPFVLDGVPAHAHPGLKAAATGLSPVCTAGLLIVSQKLVTEDVIPKALHAAQAGCCAKGCTVFAEHAVTDEAPAGQAFPAVHGAWSHEAAGQ